MKNLKSISEVAQEWGVEEDQLRYWDRLGILSPRRVGAVRVYNEQDQEKLTLIVRLLKEGYRPSEVRLMLLASAWVDNRSVSQVDALHAMFAEAQRGEVIEEPFGLNSYNTVYQRVQRTAKKHGKKVLIRTTKDRKALEAKVI